MNLKHCARVRVRVHVHDVCAHVHIWMGMKTDNVFVVILTKSQVTESNNSTTDKGSQ
jgi:hypothetical protein